MKKKLTEADQAYSHQIEALMHETSGYTDDVLNRKPADGGWSAIQVMHHLILSEEMSLRYVHKKMSFDSHYPKTGIREAWRYFLLWAFLNLPFKWKAPERIGGNPEVLPAFATHAETFEKWRKIRNEWSSFFEKMPDDLAGRTVYKHPRVGKIGWKHMIGFFKEHLGRHRKQIMLRLAGN